MGKEINKAGFKEIKNQYQLAKKLVSQGKSFDDLPRKLKKAFLNYHKLKLGSYRSDFFKKSILKNTQAEIELKEEQEKELKKLDKKINYYRIGANILTTGGSEDAIKARENFENKKYKEAVFEGVKTALDCATSATLCFGGAISLAAAWKGKNLIIPIAKEGLKNLFLKFKTPLKIPKIKLPKINLPQISYPLDIIKSIPLKVFHAFKTPAKAIQSLSNLNIYRLAHENYEDLKKNLKGGNFKAIAWNSVLLAGAFPFSHWNRKVYFNSLKQNLENIPQKLETIKNLPKGAKDLAELPLSQLPEDLGKMAKTNFNIAEEYADYKLKRFNTIIKNPASENFSKEFEYYYSGMRNFGSVDEKVLRGSNPNFDDIKWLKSQGVTDIIDLRVRGGSEASLFAEELENFKIPQQRRFCGNLGIKFHSRPINLKNKEELEKIYKVIKSSKGKVFIHCVEGRERTGLAVAYYRMKEYNWNEKKAIAEAEKYGLYWDSILRRLGFSL
ncbi:MAG: dual specificity protein phosphatase family protein [Armatimonadetes bacterium]|nr:dual specificity protein phosphatase family protein [Armatimonadota bacterium]